MSHKLLSDLRKTSVAGLPQDYWQMNREQTKDRLGANGLVNKGKYTNDFRDPKHMFNKTIDMTRTRISNPLYAT